ncbi:MAG: AAA family ATPase [Vicingaceae bacterium]|nr:AAA family ATPase [Vicingaceae bacterium]
MNPRSTLYFITDPKYKKQFMESLILEHQIKLTQVNTTFKRYLFHSIDLNNRLIAIKGARGVGKTTLLLQIAKEKLGNTKLMYLVV